MTITWNHIVFVFYTIWLIAHSTQVESTLSQQKKMKKSRGINRPEGVAYDNKKFPNKCQVCRLMAEEMEKSMRVGEEGMSEEEKKKKKRQDRRKSKAEKMRERALPILLAIENVCDQMLEYIPQNEDRSKFRYVKKKDLRETKHLITSQLESEEAADVVGEKYDKFYHPETSRIMSLCDELINKYENDLVRWNSQEDRGNLMDFFCKERVLDTNELDAKECLSQESIKNNLWTKAFDVILETRPELKNTEF